MNFPFIENTNNFLVDYHLVYAGVLVYLIAKRAGHVFGLDAVAERLALIRHHPFLRPLVARGAGQCLRQAHSITHRRRSWPPAR